MSHIKRFSIRLHATLLRLYPTQYRAEFGDEISATFADIVADTNTLAMLLALLWREVRDWPGAVLAEYWLWAESSIAYHHNQQRRMQHSRPGLLPPKMAAWIPPFATSLIERNPFIHRLFDLLLATCGLLIFSPFLPIIFVLIRLDSTGPVLYRGTRADVDRQSYTMYKFRSMVEAPGNSGLSITRVGMILRKSRLDELPQLFNVIKGEMRVIGPRPGAPS